MSGYRLAVIALAFLLAIGVALAKIYQWQVSEACAAPDAAALAAGKDPVCEDGDPDAGNSIFFAMQTITTTGYGSGVNATLSEVQNVSSAGMFLGAFFWALFTGAIVAELLKSKQQRKQEANERELASKLKKQKAAELKKERAVKTPPTSTPRSGSQ